MRKKKHPLEGKRVRVSSETKELVRRARKEQRKQLGRPSHKPTRALRDRIITLRADGWAVLRIGRLLGISEATMWKYYRYEIDHGADIVLDELNKVIRKRAKQGHMPAVRMARENALSAGVISRERLADSAQQSVKHEERDPPPEPKKEPKIGKKELANLEAKTPDASSPFGALLTTRTIQ